MENNCKKMCVQIIRILNVELVVSAILIAHPFSPVNISAIDRSKRGRKRAKNLSGVHTLPAIRNERKRDPIFAFGSFTLRLL